MNFPEDNFQILYSNGKAQKVVIKKNNKSEFLFLTENIDLTKVSEIYQAIYPGIAGVLRMSFPEGVKTQVYENGTFTKTITEYYLEFFFNRNGMEYYADQFLLRELANTTAFFKLENKISCEQFIFQGNTNLKKYGSKIEKNASVYHNSLVEKKIYYMNLAIKGGLKDGISHDAAANYLETLINLKLPYHLYTHGKPHSSLLHHLERSENYLRMGEIINSPDIYFKSLTEWNLIKYKADYLIGIGKCIEAEKLLLDTYNSPNSSKTLKRIISSSIRNLYLKGCNGKNSKVKKNKILANQYL